MVAPFSRRGFASRHIEAGVGASPSILIHAVARKIHLII